MFGNGKFEGHVQGNQLANLVKALRKKERPLKAVIFKKGTWEWSSNSGSARLIKSKIGQVLVQSLWFGSFYVQDPPMGDDKSAAPEPQSRTSK